MANASTLIAIAGVLVLAACGQGNANAHHKGKMVHASGQKDVKVTNHHKGKTSGPSEPDIMIHPDIDPMMYYDNDKEFVIDRSNGDYLARRIVDPREKRDDFYIISNNKKIEQIVQVIEKIDIDNKGKRIGIYIVIRAFSKDDWDKTSTEIKDMPYDKEDLWRFSRFVKLYGAVSSIADGNIVVIDRRKSWNGQ